MSSETSWQHAVSAARAAQKPLYFVTHIAGGVIEATVSKEAALKYRAEQARPHLYKVHRQEAGYLTEVT